MTIKFLLFVIPTILFIFLTNGNDVSALDFDLECPENKVVVVRTTNPNPICVSDSTAQRWVILELAEIIDESEEKTQDILTEIYESTAEIIPKIQHLTIPDDLSRAQSYLITFSDGDFTKPLTFQTFFKVEPGEEQKYLKSFYDLGFDSYFSLESIPSIDKIEFYDIVAKTINPGDTPRPFDVSIDVLAGDNSVIITIIYPKCRITEYSPYSQDFVLFYQYSDTQREEIRDRTVLYCSGLKMQVYDEKNQKIIPTELLPFIPTDNDSVQGFIAHFSGRDFDGLYTVETFSDFSPSTNFIETPFDVITVPGNPFGNKPQFFLESLPSNDKEELYRYYAMYVNPGQPPKPVNVSIDMILGDGTILQRWNYVDCIFYDYTTYLEDSLLKFNYAEDESSEIRDKSEFTCAGTNLETSTDKPISKFPIRDSKYDEKDPDLVPTVPKFEDRAQSFRITAWGGGDFEQTFTSDRFQKFEPIKRDRGPLTPITHTKQYDFGFVVESLPQKDVSVFYKFLALYINPGPAPAPFDVNIDTINGDGSILHRLQYVNCDAVDFWWYLQQANWFNQFSQKEQDEIRERYIFYCEGFGIDFPE